MESQRHQHEFIQDLGERRITKRAISLVASSVLLFAYLAVTGNGQQNTPNPLPNRPIVIPNRTLGPDEMRNLADKNARKHSFDAANAARKKVIDDETNNLLILARDLKARTESMGPEGPSALMQREAAMIELLANDVKEKMKLTVSPD